VDSQNVDKEVISPCTTNCKIYGSYCRSCGRTLSEIAIWPYLDNQERKAIIKLLDQRKKYLPMEKCG
jgi:predicted Fe-S protein YdhL (DUF1289 family)